jgi:hypothetical protein
MQNRWPDLACNVYGLVLAAVLAAWMARHALPMGMERSAVRPVLCGMVVGVFSGAVVSGVIRIFGIAFGHPNRTLPAGLFFALFCPLATLVFVSEWKRVVLSGRCALCGYRLDGLPSQVCPECGTSFE